MKKNLSLDDLLKKDKSVSIHQRNLQILWTETYKARTDLGPEIMKDIFQKWFSSAKSKKPHIVLWNRKHIFPCPQNMGDPPLRD